jgi:hypothetical protein
VRGKGGGEGGGEGGAVPGLREIVNEVRETEPECPLYIIKLTSMRFNSTESCFL